MDNYKQLYEKTNEEYKGFYPLTDILSIIDKESGKNLKQLLNQYNHIRLDWKGNTVDTRNSVPLILRHKGLFVTYDNGTSIVTEFYKGEDISVSINSIWQNDNNWTDLSPGASLADNEDIAEIDGKFKFADRNYSPAQFTGMGKVILRKNLTDVGGGIVKNVLTQDMINKSNTIYEIRYDFDLNSEEITIPEGCMLDFQGGSLSNGIITGAFTFRNTPIFNNVKIRLFNNLDNEVKDFGYGCYVESIDNNYNDAKKIADLGISYVIYYNYKVHNKSQIMDSIYDMRLFALFGIGVILYLDCSNEELSEIANNFSQEKNLIGWYVYDEPEAKNISIEQQDTRISILKEVKKIPCCCAINGDFYTLAPISLNYDFIYLSQYYNILNNKELKTGEDILSAYGRITSYLNYGMDKIYPIYETYNATKEDDYLLSNMLVKKSLYKNKGVFFIYSADVTSDKDTIGGIKYSDKLQNIVRNVINSNIPNYQMELQGFVKGETNFLNKAQSFIPIDSKAVISIDGPAQLATYKGVYFYSTGEYFKVKFNRKIKGCRIVLSWNNYGNTNPQKFNVIIPTNNEEGYIIKSLEITPVSGKKTEAFNVDGINNDSIIISSGSVNNGYQFVDTMIVVGISVGETKTEDYETARYSVARTGSTADRPTLSTMTNFWTPDKGFMFYDKSLEKPIWWTNVKWIDATGTEV